MILFLYPEGKKRAVTFSYDDGRIDDRRLVEMLNHYRLKGTFHLNAGKLDTPGFVTKSELKDLYMGHEVSAHSLNHPFLNQLCKADLINEILEDRRQLEKLNHSIVRGMSYPYGKYSDEIIDTVQTLGIEYSRTVDNTGNYYLPDDFMKWDPTCHHNQLNQEVIDKFLFAPVYRRCYLLYIWGHSFEFQKNDNWEFMETMCELLADKKDVWYATNIEIKDYLSATRNLVASVDRTTIYNPTCQKIWIETENEIKVLMPNETWTYK